MLARPMCRCGGALLCTRVCKGSWGVWMYPPHPPQGSPSPTVPPQTPGAVGDAVPSWTRDEPQGPERHSSGGWQPGGPGLVPKSHDCHSWVLSLALGWWKGADMGGPPCPLPSDVLPSTAHAASESGHPAALSLALTQRAAPGRTRCSRHGDGAQGHGDGDIPSCATGPGVPAWLRQPWGSVLRVPPAPRLSTVPRDPGRGQGAALARC